MTISDQFRSDRSVIPLLLSNLLTIAWALFEGWRIADVMFVYWVQSVVIGYFNYQRIMDLKKFSTKNFRINNRQPDPTPETRKKVAVFFAMHYGIFHAAYLGFIPEQNNGNTPYVLTLKDVPYGKGAFWSVTVYNSDGYLVKNKLGKYVINSQKATYNADGSATIHFGGNPEQQNFLPIIDNWNYWIRVYLPQKAYFDGSWKAPEAQPAK